MTDLHPLQNLSGDVGLSMVFGPGFLRVALPHEGGRPPGMNSVLYSTASFAIALAITHAFLAKLILSLPPPPLAVSHCASVATLSIAALSAAPTYPTPGRSRGMRIISSPTPRPRLQ